MDRDSGVGGSRSRGRGRLLLFSYAFPPMQTQMTPVVVKPMAALARHGYEVDVLCAEPFSPHLGTDTSLLPYAESHSRSITRLSPPNGMFNWSTSLRLQSLLPDLMWILNGRALEVLMDMDLTQYDAVMTWSPFHSINTVMARVKKNRPRVCWIAQFSDPWAGNPLERRRLTRFWNAWQEPRAIAATDFVVHSSAYSRRMMIEHATAEFARKCEVIPHPFDEELLPSRPKARNDRITLRYVGVLFGRRSPEPLLRALGQLLEERRDLADRLHVELVGAVPAEMLLTPAARALPAGLVTHTPSVSYLGSIEKMYDADILLLIEADVRMNLFVPSKLSDYIGARTPIVGITPPGGSEDVLMQLGCWHARPADIDGIRRAIEDAIDYVTRGADHPWCAGELISSFSSEQVAQRFASVLERAQ